MMRRKALWAGTAAVLAALCGRGLGVAFGKALAFGYAVVVSLVANVVFDSFRHPPAPALAATATVAAAKADPAAAWAKLPAELPLGAAGAAMPPVSAVADVTPIATPRPGPGSGGLY